MNRVELQRALEDRFNVEELRHLCFTLEIPHEDMSPQLSVFARQLIEHCERRNKVQILIETCRTIRSEYDDWIYAELIYTDHYGYVTNPLTDVSEVDLVTQEQIQVALRSLTVRCIMAMTLNAVFILLWWLMYVGAILINEKVSPVENNLFPTALALGTVVPIVAYIWTDTKLMFYQFRALKAEI